MNKSELSLELLRLANEYEITEINGGNVHHFLPKLKNEYSETEFVQKIEEFENILKSLSEIKELFQDTLQRFLFGE